MTSDTSSAATPASASAASIAIRPSSWAGVAAKLPRKLPTGVRLAAVMTTSVMSWDSLNMCAQSCLQVQLPACVRLRKMARQRDPHRRPGAGANDHSDMAKRKVKPIASDKRRGGRDNAVGGRYDLADRAAKRRRIDSLSAHFPTP